MCPETEEVNILEMLECYRDRIKQMEEEINALYFENENLKNLLLEETSGGNIT